MQLLTRHLSVIKMTNRRRDSSIVVGIMRLKSTSDD